MRLVVAPGERVTFTHAVKAPPTCELDPGFFVTRGEKTVVDTTYARMRGHPLRLRGRRDGERSSGAWRSICPPACTRSAITSAIWRAAITNTRAARAS